MKEHKKLYKAGKNWVVATMAVASLGVIAMQQQVSADSTTSGNVEDAANSKDSVQVAQQAKNQAQSAYDQQSQVVASAASAVVTAQSSADAADKSLDDAKSVAASAGATSANIASASAAVDAQQTICDHITIEIKNRDVDVNNNQTGNHNIAKPSATNVQELNESIEQNQIKLPDGYVKAFNKQIAAIGNQTKNMSNDNFDFEKSQNDINAKVSTLQGIAKGLTNLNPYHHNTNDAKVTIKDIHNLDNDVATNLSLWYAGVLNNLVKNYDLRNIDGNLLRDVMRLRVTNYSLETAKYINDAVNKDTNFSDEWLNVRGAGNDEYNLVAPGMEKSSELPAFLKAIDSAVSPWGQTRATDVQKITNLDELKEATWNNLILYNLLDSSANSNDADADKFDKLSPIERLKNTEHSSLDNAIDQTSGSIFGPALFMQRYEGTLDSKLVSEYSFAIAVDRAGQITPHWYHVAPAYQNNKDNQSIQLSDPAKPHAADNDISSLQKQYNDAKAKLSTLEANLAQLQKVADNVKAAQRNADDAHTKLTAAKQKLQEEQAKLATLKAALDKAVKDLNVAKAQASVNAAQAEYTKATNEYNAQKSVVNKDQAAVDAQQKVVNEKKSQLDAAKQKLAEVEKDSDNSKSEAYIAQQAKVDASQKVLNDKKAAVKQAQDKVNSAKGELNQIPAKIDKTQDSIVKQNDAVKVAQQNVDEANASLTKAQAKLESAKKDQANAQNLVNDKKVAKENADNAVAKLENEIKNSGLEQAQQNVTKVQDGLNKIKKTNSENEAVLTKNQSALADTNQKIDKVNEELKNANKAVTDAQNEVTAKQQVVTEAQNKLADLQKQVAQDEATGAAGFFKSIADNKDNSEDLRDDAQTAYAIVNGTYSYIPNWYSNRVNLGAKGDATSIEEMKHVLPYLAAVNQARSSHNKAPLGISLTDMAVAMIDADYQNNGLEHPDSLYQSENLTTDLNNPVASWMEEESIWNEMLKAHPEYADVLNSSHNIYDFFVNHKNDYMQVGHFLNLMDPDITQFGIGRHRNAVSWDTNPQLEGPNSLSVENYDKVFKQYTESVLKENRLKVLQKNVETAKKNLTSAQNAVEAAKNNVTALQKNLEELNDGATKIKQAITATQNAISKGKQNLALEQTQLDKANKAVADIKEQVASKTQDLNKVKDVQTKANDDLTKAQENLNNATTAVKAAQQDVNNAQNNVNEKKDALSQTQAKLSSLEQKLNNLKNTKNDLTKAETDLANATKEESAAEKDVKTQQDALDSLKAKGNDKVSSAQDAVTNAQHEYDAASQKLQDDKNVLSQSENKLSQLQQAMADKKQALDNANKSFDEANNSTSTTDSQYSNTGSNDGNKGNNSQPSTNKGDSKNNADVDGNTDSQHSNAGSNNGNKGNNSQPSTNIENSKTDADSTANGNSQQTSLNADSKSTIDSTITNKAQNSLKNNTATISTSTGVTAVSATEKSNGTVTELAVNHETSFQKPAQKMTNTKELPQTGNSDSAIAGLFGVALSMFGFGLARKKKY
ncbi:LPXTG cell wall anchor domain-containing protein [Lactobacillus reuteri]|nr:LPXTG cell wall anchor domain-containing protein [Limosilactobacillus reuteri]